MLKKNSKPRCINRTLDINLSLRDKELKSIVHIWKLHGDEINPLNSMPKHPEFFYRHGGYWKGWNDFLNVSELSIEYAFNQLRDEIEDEAYVLFIKG